MSFRLIKKLFPLKADSIDEFIELVEREQGTSVVAEPRIKAKNGSYSAKVGYIGNYKYSTRFQSETQTGRPIILDEVYGGRFGSERGFADSEERSLAALRCLVTADDRLKNIKEKLVQIEVRLIGPTGVMDEKTYQRMQEDANKYNITPF